MCVLVKRRVRLSRVRTLPGLWIAYPGRDRGLSSGRAVAVTSDCNRLGLLLRV